MSRTVFILGAGASAQAGAPLMSNFFDIAENLLRTGKVDDVKESFETIFRAKGLLQYVHSKSQLDINNLESVFAAFEIAKTLNKFPGYEKEDFNELVSAMKVLISKTIEKTIEFPVNVQSVNIPEPYDNFIGLIKAIENEAIPKQRISILTFNYDMAIDYGFHFTQTPYNYFLGEYDNDEHIPLLKLHGSLNWAFCPKCNKVVPWPLWSYFKKHDWNRELLRNPKTVNLRIGSSLGNYEHACGSKVKPEPIIVPPTWNKTEYHNSVSTVWSKAAKELGDAENIFIIGYSLPETDSFFRYLYALGTVDESTLIKKIWVFNPDSTGEVEARFRKMLGPGAESRFEYYQMTFEESLRIIKQSY